jgi:hypothetical protein
MKASQSENLGLSAMGIRRQRNTAESQASRNMDILCGYALKFSGEQGSHIYGRICAAHSSVTHQ